MKRKSQEQNHFGWSRRTFIKNTVTGLGSITMGSLALSLLEGFASPHSKALGISEMLIAQQKGGAIAVDISKPENQPLATVGGTLALGRNEIDRNGILLFRETETTVKAFSRKCTHMGCTVGPFTDGVSTCPCHRSQFNLSGNGISGPATRPLLEYKTSLAGNTITIKAS